MKLPIYHYDRYGSFVREDRVEMQMAGGRLFFELPINATPVEPPIAEPGLVAVYLEDQEQWVTLEDHRKEIWRTHRGELIEIQRPGRPEDMGFIERVKTDECT